MHASQAPGPRARLAPGEPWPVPEPGDLLVLLTVAAIVRQLLWPVPDRLAWAMTGAATIALAAAALALRRPRPPLPGRFWLVVAVPLLAFWFLHLPHPDQSFDVLNYHLLHAERALRGLLAVPGDFFPHYFPFLDPAPDMVTGLLRHALGFRLGTLGNTLAILWTACILERTLAGVTGNPWVRSAAVLFVVCSEGLLWEVGNYMVDVLGVPFLLEATVRSVPLGQQPRKAVDELPAVGFLLGAAVALKLSNLVFAACVGALLAWRLLEEGASAPPARTLRRVAAGALAFALPLAPHTWLVWSTTGSPVFPHFNAFFRSPLFPPFNTADVRFGPASLGETLAWPLVSLLEPSRLSELARTSGRLALGFLAALPGLLQSSEPRLRRLSAAVLAGSVLWALGSGNHRYGLFLETGGGLLAVLLWLLLWEASRRRRSPLASAGVTALGLVFAIQAGLALVCVRQGDWSGRWPGFHHPAEAVAELGNLGRDHRPERFLPSELGRTLKDAEVLVDAGPGTNGLIVPLRPGLPVVSLLVDSIFHVAANRHRFEQALEHARGKRVIALSAAEDRETARARLGLHGFTILSERREDVPFYSFRTRLELVLFELGIPGRGEAAASGRFPR